MHAGLKLCCACVLMIGLGACTTLPDWAKPEILYGEAFSKAKQEAGEGLKTDLPEVAVTEVDGRVQKDPLSNVFEELGGDRANQNYADQPLRGGGKVHLPDNPPPSGQAETDEAGEKAGATSTAPETREGGDQPKKSVFRGLSGNF
ncbi:MAG: hypothetical protein ACON4J_02270 [Parvibaculales bacterium]